MHVTREVEVIELDSQDTAARLENVLSQIAGVSEVNANPESHLVWVTFDDTIQSAQTIYEAIQREGCSVSMKPSSATSKDRPGRLS